MPVDIIQSRERILEFLGDHKVGVLATADATGKPHAATVYVTHDQQLNMYFVTKRETQKCRNLTANPRAAIAIYDAATQTTVQVEGNVTEITDQAQSDRVFAEVQRTVMHTSTSGVPPTSKMAAGSYVTYKLESPNARMATFTHTSVNDYQHIFEVIL